MLAWLSGPLNGFVHMCVCDVCVHKEVLEFVVDKSVSGLTGTMMSVGRGSSSPAQL